MILIQNMLSTKERILASATKLLDAGGPSAVTLRAVGDAAGISQSAPYRHFADKRALLDAMVRQIIEQMRSMVETARSEASSPILALNLVVGQYYIFARRYPVRYRLLLEESRIESPVGHEARQAFMTVADIVQDAQQSGELRDGDPQQIVALIFGAVHGMADLEQFGLVKIAADSESQSSLPKLLVEMLSRPVQAAIA
jgi:AcrR family transcriptional regulator